MIAHSCWSGQIRIALVAFAVALKSAVKTASRIPLHEYERKSGERIHHRNVTENGREVADRDIVEGI